MEPIVPIIVVVGGGIFAIAAVVLAIRDHTQEDDSAEE